MRATGGDDQKPNSEDGPSTSGSSSSSSGGIPAVCEYTQCSLLTACLFRITTVWTWLYIRQHQQQHEGEDLHTKLPASRLPDAWHPHLTLPCCARRLLLSVLLFVSSAAWTVTNLRDELGDILAGDESLGDLALAGLGLGEWGSWVVCLSRTSRD